MTEGYIAAHRKMLDNPIVCKDADHLAVWIYLLLNAVYAPTDVVFHGKRITLQPGQLTTGRKVIADKMKISESKVQRILKSFEIEHQIEQRTDRQCRLITIVSWSEYQISGQRVNNGLDTFSELEVTNNAKIEQRVNNATADVSTDRGIVAFKTEQRVNNERTTSEQRVNTKKEINNKRNKEISVYDGLPEELKRALMDFEAMRKAIRKPITTDRARKLLLTKLQSLAGDDDGLKVRILEQSIMNSWQGVFPLHDQDIRGGKSKNANPFLDMLERGDY